MKCHELVAERSFRRLVRSIYHARNPVPFSNLVFGDAETQFVQNSLHALASEGFVRLHTHPVTPRVIVTVEATPQLRELALEARVLDETVTQNKLNEVLVVEDDPEQAQLAIRAMRNYSKDYQIVVAGTGAEALDYLFRRKQFKTRTPGNPRLILLDIGLPGMSGHEVLNAIRESRETAHIPVVMFTCAADDPSVVRAFATGATSYLVKPIAYEHFKDVIKSVCDYWLK